MFFSTFDRQVERVKMHIPDSSNPDEMTIWGSILVASASGQKVQNGQNGRLGLSDRFGTRPIWPPYGHFIGGTRMLPGQDGQVASNRPKWPKMAKNGHFSDPFFWPFCSLRELHFRPQNHLIPRIQIGRSDQTGKSAKKGQKTCFSGSAKTRFWQFSLFDEKTPYFVISGQYCLYLPMLSE